MKNTEIEELIADAKAEEEVAKEQKNAKFGDMFYSRSYANKITIDLNEYMALKFKERDLDLILKSIFPHFGLNYGRDALRFRDGDDLTEVIKIIYPEIYGDILEDLIAKGDEE